MDLSGHSREALTRWKTLLRVGSIFPQRKSALLSLPLLLAGEYVYPTAAAAAATMTTTAVMSEPQVFSLYPWTGCQRLSRTPPGLQHQVGTAETFETTNCIATSFSVSLIYR